MGISNDLRHSIRSFARTPLSTVALVLTIGHIASVPREVMVTAKDACGPDTFNAALKDPHACKGPGGGVTFELFIDTLMRMGSIGSWHFAPPSVEVRVGQTFLVTNRGRETHTFTVVEEFGGGIVRC
jgi:hypothetical protein